MYDLPWFIIKALCLFHSNCQAVQECGGLKTLCDLVSQTHSENVLERTTWALGMLAIDLKWVHPCLLMLMQPACWGRVEGWRKRSRSAKRDHVEMYLNVRPPFFNSNRNFIRQYGGIANICKKLQESPSQQVRPCQHTNSSVLYKQLLIYASTTWKNISQPPLYPFSPWGINSSHPLPVSPSRLFPLYLLSHSHSRPLPLSPSPRPVPLFLLLLSHRWP